MIEEHVFVGAVSIILGGVLLAAAVFNWDWCYELHKSRWVEWLCGRLGARIFFALLGLGLIALGLAIALGLLNRGTSAAMARPAVNRRQDFGLIAHVPKSHGFGYSVASLPQR